MNVLFISQCEGKALTETRKILDNFACRCGDRVWQTAITQQGLDSVYTQLKKTARKNTAVLCRWIHGKNHNTILWIVGNRRKFNENGMVPTNTTGKDMLRIEDENDWFSLESIRLVVSLAALWHDFGKATKVFQDKLQKSACIADALRHEWVSVRLFQAFVRGCGEIDEAWLKRLSRLDKEPLNEKEELKWLNYLQKDGIDSSADKPFESMPPIARVVSWLILSHHRMPVQRWDKKDFFVTEPRLKRLPELIDHDWGYKYIKANKNAFKQLWKFQDLPHKSKVWQEKIARIAEKLIARSDFFEYISEDNTFFIHVGRMALMLADHEYSARSDPKERIKGDETFNVYANTNRSESNQNKAGLNQKLDEHLLGVEKAASSLLRYLPRLKQDMPSLGVVRAFRQQSAIPKFRWQDKAYALAAEMAERTKKQGFFGINIASTGCGKTFANGKICYALAGEDGARFTIALGLRVLTLQTGDAYREKLGLGPADIAVLAGTAAVRELYNCSWGEKDNTALSDEEWIEELREPLLPEMSTVSYEGTPQTVLEHWLTNRPKAVSLLEAPILACTIDHLVSATEGLRGGKQIVPMLRLLTSDLVLDEPDDFDTLDLPALSRLVFWAGMLGSRVILSSATIPEALALGLFEAYQQGRKIYAKNRGDGSELPVCCAWFDEFGAEGFEIPDEGTFKDKHKKFVRRRVEKLQKETQRRRMADILPLDAFVGKNKEDICDSLAQEILQAIPKLHEENALTDKTTGKRISLGIVRMANIDPLITIALALLQLGIQDGWHIHLCCYHARYPLCMRSNIEHILDHLLKRNMPEEEYLKKPEIQRLLSRSDAKDHVVLVLATSVAEVGRDHDYDWALVEPSSVRSIVQLAGRVRRHRDGGRSAVNMRLFSHNVKGLSAPIGKAVFCCPGFENKDKGFLLKSHDLRELLTPEQLQRIDASLRVLERDELDPEHNLADLEQAVMRHLQNGDGSKLLPFPRWWAPNAHLCGEIQRKTPFRDDKSNPVSYAFLPDDDEELKFHQLGTAGHVLPQENLCNTIEIGTQFTNMSFLVDKDMNEILELLSKEFDLDKYSCAQRFAWVDLPTKDADQGWDYHEHLGFRKQI